MCIETVAQFSYTPRYVSDHLKTQEMCNQAVRSNPIVFFLVPDHFKTKEPCIKALEVDPWQLNNITDYLVKQKMCDKAVKNDPSSLRFVPDWFVTQQKVDVWCRDDYWYHDDEMIEWYEGYKKRKTQKVKIKEELLPVAWHPDHLMD